MPDLQAFASVAAEATLRITEDGVRLRERPDTTSWVLAELAAGTTVVPTGSHAWRQVRLPDGRSGWVANEYLATGEASTPAPPPAGRSTFDPSTPTELQVQDWTCSIRSAMWMLKSIGIAVTPAEAQEAMEPRYVNSDVGLRDASGAGVVEVFRERWGVTARNLSPVSFDDVAALAGRQPLMIGGRKWGHWTAVRCNRVDSASGEVTHLVLANPGGTGPRYGQQTLDRQQFADLGWFSAVTIPLAA